MVKTNKNFALIGVGGYIAPRHLKAIKETGNELIASVDRHDSVGILDSFFPNSKFFTEFERFDRYLEKLRQEKNNKIDYVVVCSPNYLHDAHIRFGLRIGANVICEKPLVLNPWNVFALEKISKETNKKINCILQLRLDDNIIKLKKQIDRIKNKIFEVDLTYITPRGPWYLSSWKGDESKSGGLITNIGIHFFDLLIWLFGKVTFNHLLDYKPNKAKGILKLEKANVNWFLSVDRNDLPDCPTTTYRALTINNKKIEFSKYFTELHTKSYEKILDGKGFSTKDVLPSVELVSLLRNIKTT